MEDGSCGHVAVYPGDTSVQQLRRRDAALRHRPPGGAVAARRAAASGGRGDATGEAEAAAVPELRGR